jgi:hypothetical protein
MEQKGVRYQGGRNFDLSPWFPPLHKMERGIKGVRLFFVAAGFPPEADAPMAHSLRCLSHPEGCGYNNHNKSMVTSPQRGEEENQ